MVGGTGFRSGADTADALARRLSHQTQRQRPRERHRVVALAMGHAVGGAAPDITVLASGAGPASDHRGLYPFRREVRSAARRTVPLLLAVCYGFQLSL